MIWIILGYACFALAELLIVPMGMSVVGELAPPHMEGLFMGIFNFCLGYGAILAGFIGITRFSTHAPPKISNPIFMHNFTMIGGVSVIAGIVILFLIIPVAKKLQLLPTR